MSAYLTASGIEVSFGGLRALQDCSFTVEQGRITCLVGPNGAGRTTIPSLITLTFCILIPEPYRFRDKPSTAWKPRAIVARGISAPRIQEPSACSNSI